MYRPYLSTYLGLNVRVNQSASPPPQRAAPIGLYTILPLPILCGIYCTNGGSGGNIIVRNSAGDYGVGWSA